MKGRVNTGGGGGLNASVILVTAPTGSTVTCTKGGTTKTAVEKNGLWTFRGIENGEWTVRATKGGQSTSQPVNVTQFDVYRVTLAYFTATIAVTFPTDCTSVTCTKGDTVLSVPGGELSKGSYTFSVHEAGEWTLYATNGTKEKTVTVTVAEETEYTTTLRFELILFKPGSGLLSGYTASANNMGNASFTSQSLIFNTNKGIGVKGLIKPSIDLTEYTQMEVTYSVSYYNYEATGAGFIGLTKNSTMDWGTSTPGFAATLRPTGANTSTLDVTNLNGKYYFAVSGEWFAVTVTKIIFR